MDSVDFSENLKIVNIFKLFSTKYATSYVRQKNNFFILAAYGDQKEKCRKERIILIFYVC